MKKEIEEEKKPKKINWEEIKKKNEEKNKAKENNEIIKK